MRVEKMTLVSRLPYKLVENVHHLHLKDRYWEIPCLFKVRSKLKSFKVPEYHEESMDCDNIAMLAFTHFFGTGWPVGYVETEDHAKLLFVGRKEIYSIEPQTKEIKVWGTERITYLRIH